MAYHDRYCYYDDSRRERTLLLRRTLCRVLVRVAFGAVIMATMFVVVILFGFRFGDLVLGRGTGRFHFDIEEKILPGQGVITVESGMRLIEPGHAKHMRSVIGQLDVIRHPDRDLVGLR